MFSVSMLISARGMNRALSVPTCRCRYRLVWGFTLPDWNAARVDTGKPVAGKCFPTRNPNARLRSCSNQKTAERGKQAPPIAKVFIAASLAGTLLPVSASSPSGGIGMRLGRRGAGIGCSLDAGLSPNQTAFPLTSTTNNSGSVTHHRSSRLSLGSGEDRVIDIVVD
jgi:hypothetical protein